ncbi:hypothetical protein WN943_005522 [Citrus x changshan-huyou]
MQSCGKLTCCLITKAREEHTLEQQSGEAAHQLILAEITFTLPLSLRIVQIQSWHWTWTRARSNGTIKLAATEAGTSGPGGKGIWGAVTDEKRIYINIANFEEKNFVLTQSKKNTSRWLSVQSMLATAKSYSPYQIQVLLQFMGLSVWLMMWFLLDQHILKDQYMQWMPKLVKTCGYMKLELQFMVGCP